MPIGTRSVPKFWQDWVTLLLGVWLFAAPWALGYMNLPAAAWNSWIFGVVIAAFSVAALIQFQTWEEWVNVAVGIWLLVSPWVLGFASNETATALWNHVAVGLVVGGLALWDALAHGAEDRMPAG